GAGSPARPHRSLTTGSRPVRRTERPAAAPANLDRTLDLHDGPAPMQQRAPSTLRPPSLQEVVRSMVGVPRAIASWRARRRSSPVWTAAVALVLAIMLLPIVTIGVLALTPAENIWPHLVSTVLP